MAATKTESTRLLSPPKADEEPSEVSGPCMRFMRFVHLMVAPLDVHLVRPFKEELVDAELPDSTAARYLVWRKLHLTIAIPVFMLVMLLNAADTKAAMIAFGKESSLNTIFVHATQGRHGDSTVLSVGSTEQVRLAFEDAIRPVKMAMLASDILASLITAVFAGIMTLYAVCNWADHKRSSGAIRHVMGWLFVLPFVLFLIPFRALVDLTGLEADLCRIVVTDETVAKILQPLPNHTVEALCTEPLSLVDRLEARLQVEGLLYDNYLGTCPRAQRIADNLVAKNPEVAACRHVVTFLQTPLPTPPEPSCGVCRECIPYALALSRIGNQDPVSAAKNLNQTVSNVPKHCVSCVTDRTHGANKDASCTELCAKYFLVTDPEMSKVCVSRTAFDQVRHAGTLLAAANEVVRLIIGVYWAVQSLVFCMPASLSLLFAAIKSAQVLKLMIPASRFPGYVLAAAVVFNLPLLTTLLIFVQQAVGDIFFLPFGFGLVVLSFVVFYPIMDMSTICGKITQDLRHPLRAIRSGGQDMPPDADDYGLLEPQPYTEAAQELSARRLAAMLLQMACGVCLCMYVINSPLVRNLLLAAQGDLIAMVVAAATKGILTFLSITRVSMVAFADIILITAVHQHFGDWNDSDDTKEHRHEMFEEVYTIGLNHVVHHEPKASSKEAFAAKLKSVLG